MIARVAGAALPVALVALVVAALAVLAAWLGWVPPVAGFTVFALALLGGGGVSLVLGMVSVFVSAGTEHGSRPAGMLAAALGLGCLVALGVLAYGARGSPAIHDLTTNVDDPPSFSAAAANPANRGRDLSYPHGVADTPRLQQQAYADLRPIELAAGVADAYRAALAAAADLGWTIVGRDPTARTFEAEDETSVFRFVDDIVVRVRPRGAGAVVDVRSMSRVGVSDMGVNAARIRRFRALVTGR